MNPFIRKAFPYLALTVLLGAVVWSASFSQLPPADFSFNNGDEIKTVDPPKATGAPEGRIINAIFEGLLRNVPSSEPADASGNVPLRLTEGTALFPPDLTADGKTYTYTIGPGRVWSDGSEMTADDFVFSWQRMLHPETASIYAYQLTRYVVGALQYNSSTLNVGDRVEVELADRPKETEHLPFPRGTLRRGILKEVIPPEPRIPADASDKIREELIGDWLDQRVLLVEVKPILNGNVAWNAAGELLAFSRKTDATPGHKTVTKHQQCLLDFAQVGIHATDRRTLVVKLMNATSFFNELVAFYPLHPVNRRCIETHGEPGWTHPDHIVSNGPYLLEARRLRDRVRLVKNKRYWNAAEVDLETIDVFGIKSETTSLNMYLNGQLDWTTTMPNTIIPDLQGRSDFVGAPAMITYFYRLNVTRPPLDNRLVRQALNMAIDKELICDKVTKGGEIPARHLVPNGMTGYSSPLCGEYNVQRARELLAQAGYGPNGKKFPKIQILYNSSEAHQAIAEVIQQQWNNNLGVSAELTNREWGSYLDAVHQMEYTVARAGWIGDYPDPNTFLDMWLTDGENNETGWGNPDYDRLLNASAAELDPQKRMKLLREAEAILMEELPIIPIYLYVSKNLISPRVKGFSANIQDLHPLHVLKIDD